MGKDVGEIIKNATKRLLEDSSNGSVERSKL